MQGGTFADLAQDHKIVFLSIFSTLVAALIIFVATVIVSGGFAIDLVKAYVLPLVISSFTLLVFGGVLFARNKGLLGFLGSDETVKEASKEPPTDS